MDECEQFPTGPRDDQVDVLVIGLDVCSCMATPIDIQLAAQESLLYIYRREQSRTGGYSRFRKSLRAEHKLPAWKG